MSSRFKKSLSGFMAVVTAVSMGQLAPIYSAAADLAETLKVEFTSGDIDGDGKTSKSDLDALYAFLGKSAGKAASDKKYDVYKDGSVDARDLLAVHHAVTGKKLTAPENEVSGDTVRVEVGSAECVPGEQVSIDINIIDWDQEIGAAEFCLDFDSSLTLADVTCTGDYQYVSEGNEIKIYGISALADVYRGTVATLTFDVPDTAYGDYDVKIKECAVYNNDFQSLAPTTKVGLIAADVTERPLYLAPTSVNSKSLNMTWSMPYCSGELEGYIVYRDGKEIARTKETSYYDEGLETDKKYVYEVQAYGGETYLSAKSKAVTAVPQKPVINALTFPDNASVVGGKSTEVRAAMEKPVDAASYTLSYVDLNGDTQTIFTGEDTLLSAADIRWNIKDVPSGDYTLTFTITDKDGAKASKSVNVTVDTTVPEQVFGFDVFEGEKEMKLTWGIAAEAKVVGYNIYRRTEKGAYKLLTYIDKRETLEYIDKNLAEGDIYFYMMCAVDKYGQEGVYSDEKSAAAKGDETQPEVTLFLPESGKVLSHSVTLSIKAEDNVGVSSVAALISADDGKTWTKIFEGKGSSASYSFDTSAYKDAQVKIKAVAYDYAGNESKDVLHLYAIDNQGPAQVTNIRSAAVTDVTATIAWDDVPDEDLSYFIARFHKADDEKNVGTVKAYTTLGVNLTGLVPDTEYVVEAAAVDIYGNTGAYSEPFTFKTVSDEKAPIIASFAPAPNYFSKEIPVEITAQDDYSTASVTIQSASSNAKDAKWTDLTTVNNENGGSIFNVSYPIDLTDYKDGKVYLRAYAVDAAGNKGETSAVFEYIIDKTAPDAPTKFKVSTDASAIELSWEAYEKNEDSVAFSLYRSDKEDGEYVKILDNKNSLNYFDRDAEPGNTYYYKLTAIDAAGNESKMSSAVKAVLQEDKVAPTVDSVAPVDGKIVSTANNVITAGASDNAKLASMVMEYRIKKDDAYKKFASLEDIGNYCAVARGELPKAALTGESVQVRITAVDAAGLKSEPMELTYVVDNSATEITKIKAEQLTDRISLTWTAKETKLANGYYVYKKSNTGSWQRIGSMPYGETKNGNYEFSDYSKNAAGTVTYKVEAYSLNGIMTSAETQPLQIYANPEGSLVVENTQQVGVEYIYDATGCYDYYGIESIVINYGDGTSDKDTSASTAKFIHKYSETGIYTITLTVTNEQGLVSTVEQSIEVIERTLIGESVITVKTTDGKNASNINVYIDLGTERQKKLKTDASGKVKFQTAAGIHTIGVFGDGYLPTEKECTILAGSGNKFDFTVTEKDIVTADFKVERMKLDEIKAAGIDITAPENQHVLEVKLDLAYKVHEAPKSDLVYYVNSNGFVIGGNGWSGGWSDSAWYGGSDTVTKPVYINVNPETNEVDTLITLTVPIKASFLKEFFHATLTIYNNAEEQYNISDNQVKLNLPEGLTLMDVDASDKEIVNFDSLPGQSIKEIDWIIRGDKQGTYDISASYSGHLDRFNEDINAEFAPDEPITVYGESAVEVEVIVPDQLFDNEFTFEVTMTNNSPVDVYCPSTDVGAIISSAFGNSEKTYPLIRQRSIKKDGKYIRILNHDEGALEVLEPGYTYSVVYVAQGVFAGIDGMGAGMFHKSRLDLIKATLEVINGSRIPVKLSVVPWYEFIVIDELKTIDYDEDKQLVLFVTEDKHNDYVAGATITLGDQTAKTNAEGYAILDIPKNGESLKVTYPYCDVKLIPDYTGFSAGMDTVTLQNNIDDDVDDVDDDEKKPVTGYKTDYGDINIPNNADGDPDDDVYEVKTFPGNITFGESLSFEFDDDVFLVGGMSVDLAELDFPVEVSVDDEGFTVLKIGEFNTDDDDDDKLIDNYNKARDILREYKGKSVKDVAGEVVKAKPGKDNPFKSKEISANVSVLATLAGRYDKAKGYNASMAEDGICYRGEILITFEFEFEWKTTITVAAVVPIAIEAKVGVNLAADASFSISYKNDEYDFNGSLVITGEILGELFAGVGAAGVMAAGVYGEIGFDVKYTLFSVVKEEEGLNHIKFAYEVGVKAYIGPFEHKQSFISPEDPIILYKKKLPEGRPQYLTADEFYAALYDESLYAVYPNKGAGIWSAGSNKLIEGKNGYTPMKLLLDNALDTTQVHIGTIGDKLVLVYLNSDDQRSAVNSYRLMYTVYDAEKGWSIPAQLDKDKTCDYAPYLCSDGKDMYIIYQNTAAELDEKAGITDWTAAQNIAIAKFDTETNKFAEPVALTSDKSVYDSRPFIVSANGKTYAVWVSNTDASPFGLNETNTIMYSELGEKGWSAAEKLVSGLSAVTELTAGEHGDDFYAVYATDGDNDLSTTDDRTLSAIKFGEEQPFRITSGSVSSPVFAKTGADESVCLYWQQDGNIKRSSDLTHSGTIFAEDESSLSGGFTISGNRILWTMADEEKASNLYESVFDKESGKWSAPVKLTSQGAYLEGIEAVEFGGKTVTVMDRKTVEITEEDVNTANTVVMAEIAEIEDIALEEVYFNKSDYEKDKTVPVELTVKNKGEKAVNSVHVTAKDDAGKEVFNKVIDANIPENSYGTVTADLDFSASKAYTVTVNTAKDTDKYTKDNTASVEAGFSLMSVSAVKTDAKTLEVTVTNNGNTTGSDEVILAEYLSGKELDKLTFSDIEPGKSAVQKVDLTKLPETSGDDITVRGKDTNASDIVLFDVLKGIESTGSFTLGDVNGDGQINSSDATKVLQEYAALSTGKESILTDEQKKAADVNSDGQINSNDASAILVYYSKASTGGTPSFSAEEANNNEKTE